MTVSRCLSVCQPFADLIVSGAKTVELRGWNTAFRGDFMVHAPQRARAEDCRRLGISNPVRGAIVGRAEIYGVRRYSTDAEVAADAALHHAGPGFGGRRFGFLLRRACRFRVPIPCRGRLGFFEIRIPGAGIGRSEIIADMIDEEHRYGLVGHH